MEVEYINKGELLTALYERIGKDNKTIGYAELMVLIEQLNTFTNDWKLP